MKRILFILTTLCMVGVLNAQPQKSRVQNNNRPTAARNKTAAAGTDRASLMFPTAVDVPEDPSWRRDIYRSIDLTKDENAALYYPVEPQGGQMNLFTLLFKQARFLPTSTSWMVWRTSSRATACTSRICWSVKASSTRWTVTASR